MDVGLFDFFGNLIRQDARQSARIPIAGERDLTGRSGAVAQANQHYVRLMLSEMFLRSNTEWFTQRYPLVYSLIGMSYGDQPKLEFANVSGKNKFEITQADLNHSILRNYALTPLLPFRGGQVEIDLGLVSMRASDLIQAFAKTVSEVAGALTLGQVAAVASMSSAVASGVQQLLGAGESTTRLTFHDLATGEEGASMRSGYVLLSDLAASAFPEKGDRQVWMTDAGVRLGADKDHLRTLEPQDYMVLEVRLMATRDDWQSLGSIGKPLDDAIEAKLGGRSSDAQALLNQSKMAAIRSPDLTRGDAARVVRAIEAYYEDQAAIEATVADQAAQKAVAPSGAESPAAEGAPIATWHLGPAVMEFGD